MTKGMTSDHLCLALMYQLASKEGRSWYTA